jgi:hypothetical protein
MIFGISQLTGGPECVVENLESDFERELEEGRDHRQQRHDDAVMFVAVGAWKKL